MKRFDPTAKNDPIPKRHFFRALLLVAYDSGLRPVDLKLLEWKHIDFKRSIAVIVQHKTGNTHCFKLSPEAIEAIKKIVEPRRDRVFPSGRDGLHKQLRRLYRLAERFGFTRKKGQSLAQLRKVHATEIYKKHGLAAAAESLGHVSGSGLAKRHYVDATAQHIGNLPPSLE